MLKRTIPYITKGKWTLPDLVSSKPVGALPVNVPKQWRASRLPQWKKQMFALQEKFPEGWDPKKKLSRDQMAELREIKTARPNITNDELSSLFKVSPEAIRRILKSRWRPNADKSKQLNERWIRRGQRLGAKQIRQGPAKPRVSGAAATKRLRDPGQNIF